MRFRKSTVKKLISAILTILMITELILGIGVHITYAAMANHVVISEIYGGGVSSTIYLNDYIELYNPTANTIDLSGWSLQYAPASGSTWVGTNLTGSIAPYHYFLVQESGGSTGTPLPPPDVIGNTAMSATQGKVALVGSTTALSGTNPSNDPQVIDFVGYGAASGCEIAPVPQLNISTSAHRKDNFGQSIDGNGSGWDDNNNSTDFYLAPPDPQNSLASIPLAYLLTGYTIEPGYAEGYTKITYTAEPGNTLKYIKQAGPVTVPALGADASSIGIVYSSGDCITGTSVGDHIGLYEMDSSNRIVKFADITLQASHIATAAPIITGYTITPGDIVGYTKITYTAGPGNTLKYIKQAGSLTVPVLAEDAGSIGTIYNSGSNIIEASAGEHIGLYEVDSLNQIVKFTDIIIQAVDIAVLLPTVNSVTVSPITTSVIQGGTQQLTATVSVTGGAIQTVNWTSNGVAQGVMVNGSGLVSVAADATSGDYIITATSAVDGSKTGTATISVTAAPVAPNITTQPQSKTVTEGQSATFTVAATGTSPFSYQWKRNSSDMIGAITPTLMISNAQESDEGSYTCSVSNSAGNVTSNAATLAVNPAGSFILTAIPGDRSTDLSWDSVTEAVYYNVYKDSSLIDTLPAGENNYEMTGLTNGATYTFEVKATDGMMVVVASSGKITSIPRAPSSNSSGGGGGFNTPTTLVYNADAKAGNGSETKLPVTINKDNRAASIDTGSQSFAQGGTVITIPSIPDVDTYSVGIRVPDISTSGVQGMLSLHTDICSVTVPSNMLKGVSVISGSKAEISIGKGDKDSLPEVVKDAIGHKLLISIRLFIDGKQIDWSNPNAIVTVSIPYTPTAAELAHPESIVIWYIDGSGNVVTIPNGHYDQATGMVTFDITHFSDYAVAYNKVSFIDVAAGAWYNKAVSFIAAREITNGTGNANYGPEAKLTRVEFLIMLMKAYSIVPGTNSTDNFFDAGNTYYTGYLAAAKRLGISSGIGNNMYAPEKEITRQEMFTLLYNNLKIIGCLPEGTEVKDLSDFTDASQIDTWARDAMTLLLQTGTISGSGGKLNPISTTSRAEMAQVLYNLLVK